MARRRGLGGFANNPVLMAVLQDYFLRRRQSQADERQINAQREMSTFTTGASLLDDVAKGSIHPDQIPNEMKQVLPFDFNAARPSDETLAGPLYDQIRTATNQAQVPTGQDIVSYFKTKKMATDPTLGPQVMNMSTEPGQLPSANLSVKSPPMLEQMQAQRQGKLAAIDSAQELELDRDFAKAKGVAYNTGMGTEQATKDSFPAFLEREAAQARQAGSIDRENFQAMTPLEVGRAGQVAGAQARAGLAPDIVAAEIDKFQQMEAIRVQNRVPTDAQSRAGGLLGPLQISDKGALEMEKNGVGLNFGTQALGNMPGLSKLLPQDQLKYLQHAQNFLNLATLILSGVTARPDEYERYLGTLFALGGEAKFPEVVLQKQKAREAFVASVQRRAQMGGTATLDDIMRDAGLATDALPAGSRDQTLQELESLRSRPPN